MRAIKIELLLIGDSTIHIRNLSLILYNIICTGSNNIEIGSVLYNSYNNNLKNLN